MTKLPEKNIDKWMKSCRLKHVKISYITTENPQLTLFPGRLRDSVFTSNEECAREMAPGIIEYLSVGLHRPRWKVAKSAMGIISLYH